MFIFIFVGALKGYLNLNDVKAKIKMKTRLDKCLIDSSMWLDNRRKT